MDEGLKTFADFQEAFAYCYECGNEVQVMIQREVWRLYPDGRGLRLGEASASESERISDYGEADAGDYDPH